MAEKTNVISLEKELVNKNCEIFIDITKIIGTMLQDGHAIFSFDHTEAALSFDPAPSFESKLARFSQEKIKLVTEEIVEISLMLLNNQEQTLLNQAQEEGKTAEAILQKKIDAVKQYIINNKLQTAFHFYRTCIGNVLEQFAAQRIIKAASQNYPSQETILLKMTVKDNLDEINKQSILFELYEDQLDEIITILTNLKNQNKPNA
ncbi:hypothetical protein [Desulforamulus aeronauticus]|uniref:Uncharacterized protein n=1 Tax=Desulforamulus aeronauticus DSM 10349 TaxID=1121421 RepID=A0A1M6ND78_9FIRM|nr:hypothetical protein [Desulforamulus aeronauticus]SHJ93671.1 hypothetical protein SAMN02745123_00068 [Desulforamulus aeronauticus DSM 10349]